MPASEFDDLNQAKFVEGVVVMLKVQKTLAGGRSIDNPGGRINLKALGYVYGFIDAALQNIGQDMSDSSIGVPITYQILEQLFPGMADSCMQILMEHIGRETALDEGTMTGGRQYIDFNKPNSKGVPMGLARYLFLSEESV